MLEDRGQMSCPNVCDIEHGRVVPSRTQAIANSCADILSGIKGANSAGAKMVASWIESIMQEAPNVP